MKQPFRTWKMPEDLPPTECLLKRQGKSFRCADLALPAAEVCRYCKEVLPTKIKEEEDQDKKNAEMEVIEWERILSDETFGKEWV